MSHGRERAGQKEAEASGEKSGRGSQSGQCEPVDDNRDQSRHGHEANEQAGAGKGENKK